MGQLGSLQTLNLYKCRGLSALPESMGQLSSLQPLAAMEAAGKETSVDV